LELRIGLHHDAEGVAGEADDVGEVVDRVPVDLLHVRHAEGGNGELRDRVAVGPGGLGHGRRAVHAAAAGPVLDHQRLAEGALGDLAELAEIEVGAAPAGHGTISVIGLEGKGCANAVPQRVPTSSAHPAAASMRLIFESLLRILSVDYSYYNTFSPFMLDISRADLVAGVAGSGTMGRGIIKVLAQCGMRTLVFDAQPDAARRAKAAIGETLGKLAERGKLERGAADAALGRIEVVERLEALAPCQLVVEAIVEDLGAKRELFSRLEGVVGPDTVLASNTSSLSVTAMAAACKRPQRVAGYHFFNPVPVMKVVEVVAGELTEHWVTDALSELARRFGHTPIACKDTPGFVVNHAGR